MDSERYREKFGGVLTSAESESSDENELEEEDGGSI